jgi:acyl-CoA synthetase (AMP-forming)/AMP-acid ligase II
VTLRNPDYLLSQLLLTAAEKYPDRPALIFPDARLTYAQLSELSQRYARAMVGHGLSRGDHVGILAVNRLEYIALLFGCMFSGTVAGVAECAFPRSRITACSHTL